MTGSIVDMPLYLQGIILFLSQITFIYFRTLNVYFNSKLARLEVAITGIAIYCTWLIGIAIGAHAIMEGDYILALPGLIGGTLGADLALKNRIKNEAINTRSS